MITQSRTCDTAGCLEPASGSPWVLDTGKTQMIKDICPGHKAATEAAATALGFRPTKARVGNNYRKAFVTASGTTFSTKDARLWLKARGETVPEVGRLTQKQLLAFADAH